MPVVRSKLVSRQVQESRPQKLLRTVPLKDFLEKRNRILVFRGCGGMGDIFMHRMMFEDFHRLMPDVKIDFACPKYYHEAVNDHPYLNQVIDSESADKDAYLVVYNTTTTCGRTEMRLA